MALTIHIIDDDYAVRDSTRALLESCGYGVCEHRSAEDFLGHPRVGAGCLLVDQQLPVMKGLDLLEHLNAQGEPIPAVLMIGPRQADIEKRAARVGATLLEKPTGGDELLGAVKRAARAVR